MQQKSLAGNRTVDIVVMWYDIRMLGKTRHPSEEGSSLSIKDSRGDTVHL